MAIGMEPTTNSRRIRVPLPSSQLRPAQIKLKGQQPVDFWALNRADIYIEVGR